MSALVAGSDFFVAGGTLSANSPSYVTRPADEELLQLVLAGEYAYVLTPRQLGKSSLMVRTARRLSAAGVHTAIVDLTAIGTQVTADQWYYGLASRLNSQLRLGHDLQKWWAEREDAGVVQRFTDFVSERLLERVQGKIVIFIDEIDTTLKIPFSDDFFAAIRSLYNERADSPLHRNLTFVLLGVATPADLIKDRARTPFNIGVRVDLNDIRREDAQVLETGLEAVYPARGAAIFERIFHWTGGHPYLTQKLCLAAIEQQNRLESAEDVDELVEGLFLSQAARKETNLQFVRDHLRSLSPAEQRQVLALYEQVYNGRKVADDERSFAQNQLKLVGLVRANDGNLKVRNEIYRHVFDRAWIKEAFPVDWTRRLALAAAAVVVLLVVVVAVQFLRNQAEPTPEELREERRQTFLTTTNPTLRLQSLGQIYNYSNHESTDIARELYQQLPLEEKVSVFRDSDVTDLDYFSWMAVLGTYTDVELAAGDPDEFNAILEAMEGSLRRGSSSDNILVAVQIGYWRECREQAMAGDLEEALSSCDDALVRVESEELSPNPAILFDRGMVYYRAGDAENALLNWNSALDNSLHESTVIHYLVTESSYRYMQENIRTILDGDDALRDHFLDQRDHFPLLGPLYFPAACVYYCPEQ